MANAYHHQAYFNASAGAPDILAAHLAKPRYIADGYTASNRGEKRQGTTQAGHATERTTPNDNNAATPTTIPSAADVAANAASAAAGANS
eukprot:857314-Prorocentrum_lima.AAC.1